MIDILSYFQEARHRSDDRWMVKCPAHEDDTPSLEVWVRRDRILLKCFGGCQASQIVFALGLTLRDLFNHEGEEVKRRMIDVESYHDYRDLDGKLRYQALRIRKPNGGKDFSQRRPDGRGGWTWNLTRVQRILYRLPEIDAAIEKHPNRVLVLCEGEKVADRLMSIGVLATTTVCGSNSPWEASYSEYLSDKHVAILPDNDLPGLKYASAAAGSLLIHDVPSLRIVQLDVPEKGDAVDWLDQDPDRRFALYQMILNTPFWSRRK